MECADAGQHCDEPYCHQLEFLPFKCVYCEKTFCKDHRHNESNCPEASSKEKKKEEKQSDSTGEEEKSTTQPKILKREACHLKNCNLPVFLVCSNCKEKFCMGHRLFEDHRCGEEDPEEDGNDVHPSAGKPTTKNRNLTIKKPKIKMKSKEIQLKVDRIKTKMNATGDKGVPVESRFPLKIEFHGEGNQKFPLRVYFDKNDEEAEFWIQLFDREASNICMIPLKMASA
eukprot:CAMPEP_0115021778 /NCGR_PEP_ID=MMETSP0216-20121206/31109_1 /TAXON_ID=223996 /ORGANISM="Protocruzia adherens, Strain Boccale" /LENGTH=227 /DNA_ID=CAMNT_0002394239 /DNA_START=33 /DNA_END=717 /DNA_ORIENTATION=+